MAIFFQSEQLNIFLAHDNIYNAPPTIYGMHRGFLKEIIYVKYSVWSFKLYTQQERDRQIVRNRKI